MIDRTQEHLKAIEGVVNLPDSEIKDMFFAFKLRQSYGLPKEDIQEKFIKDGVKWNECAWICMIEQEKRKSRAASMFKKEIF